MTLNNEAALQYPATEARRALYDQLRQWLEEGKTAFTPQDMYPLTEKLGKSRRWFYLIRDELLAVGVIAEGDDTGVYRIVRATDDEPRPVVLCLDENELVTSPPGGIPGAIQEAVRRLRALPRISGLGR